MVQLDARGKPVKPPPAGKYRQATPHKKGAAADLYFDGVSYRRTAGNMDQFFGRETEQMNIYRWVRDLSKRADEALRPMKVDTGRVWVADEVVVRVGAAAVEQPARRSQDGWVGIVPRRYAAGFSNPSGAIRHQQGRQGGY